MLMQPSLPPAGTAHSAEQRTVSFFSAQFRFFSFFFSMSKFALKPGPFLGPGKTQKSTKIGVLAENGVTKGSNFWIFLIF